VSAEASEPERALAAGEVVAGSGSGAPVESVDGVDISPDATLTGTA
jgi:hypothetical protein